MRLQQVQIEGLLMKYEAVLMNHGWAQATRYEFLKRASVIIRLHERQGLEYLDQRIIADYTSEVSERFYAGKLGKKHYQDLYRGIKLFVAFVEAGNLELPNPSKGARQALTPEFERIAGEYLESSGFHPNTRNDARWTTHKYFAWLAEQGYEDLTSVGAEQIQKFLLYCSLRMAMSSIHDVKLHLKKLYSYLFETRLPSRHTKRCYLSK